MKKTIVIFANSVKHHQHCVAGKDILTKEWIRPVADENGTELKDEQTKYKNPHGQFLAKPLQKMEIEFLKQISLAHQPDNYVIADKIWEQKYKIELDEIKNYIDNPDNLWLDGISSSDRISYHLIQNESLKISQSLYLIQVEKIHIYWKDRSQYSQNPQRRGIFLYKNIKYDLALTDPAFSNFQEQDLINKYMCISLGEQLNGYCYKLIASIF